MAAERQPVTHLIPRSWPPENLQIVAASGCVLRTADGSELLDAASGGLAATLGYGVPEVTEAIIERARKLQFAHSGHFATEAAERYACCSLVAPPLVATESQIDRIIKAASATWARGRRIN